ncbi:MAG TPA: NADH-quinone oxidoreductase subunit NuoK [Thermoplasmataceae archaeon]|nr:NADH-quinone oxidoreductase subunit NuoK [Thermoplasmatales archaeon AK]HLH85800.1 NADH-quinone oxidoreductase subunit NuoK [Thermoplasmataceae archaeon]
MYLFLVSMLSLILFAVGLYGIMVSNVGIKMLISIEILINSAILELVTVAVSSGTVDPIILALFGIAIGAVESVIGLSLLTATFRRIGNVAIALLREIKW